MERKFELKMDMKIPTPPDPTGMDEFLNWRKLSYDIYEQSAEFKEVQKILTSTNQNREPKGSFYLETFFEQQLKQTSPSPSNDLPMRCQSEEPNTKKRKYFMVDIAELEEKARVLKARRTQPVEQNKTPVVKEVISLVDEENEDDSTPPWTRNKSEIYSSDQRAQWWKKRDARLVAAARYAQNPQEQKEGSFTTIQDRRDEHEKRQREESAADRRQISQVKKYLHGEDSMTKPKVYGAFKPANRLGDEPQGTGWTPPKANANAGRQPSQNPPYVSQEPRKRQKIEHDPRSTNGSSRSPIDVDRDTSDRQRQSSLARSHSQTFHDSQKNLSLGEMGNVTEYWTSENTVKSKSRRARPRHGAGLDNHSNGGGPYKFKEQSHSVPNHAFEDSRDPIDDPEYSGKHTAQRPSRLEVQLPSCLPGDQDFDFQRPARHQHFGGNERAQTNKKQRSSADSESSPYFTPTNSDIPNINKFNTGSAAKPVLDGGVAQTKNQSAKVSRRKALGAVDLESSLDELDYHPNDDEMRTIAKQLLVRDKTDGTESINVDDSEDDDVADADIAHTKFAKTKSKDAALVGIYKLRQLFCLKKAWLCKTNNMTWTMKLHKEKQWLEVTNERGEVEQKLLTSPFNFFEDHEQSPKLVVHSHRELKTSNPTTIYLEFSNLKERKNFVNDMLSAYNLTTKQKPSEYLDKVFDKTLRDSQSATALRSKPKRLREDELPDDIQVAMANSARRLADTWKHPHDAKRARTIGPERSQPSNNDQMGPPKQQGLAKNMKVESRAVDGEEAGHRTFKHHQLPEEVPATSFYGGATSGPADAGVSHGTRSSTRVVGTRAAPSPTVKTRSPSPEIPAGWTKLNPDWARDYNWRGSIIYPPQGRSRATVDKQDIYRLDEGEFLNDNLVTFYLRWLENRLEERNPDVAKRIYFHNSFFFEKLSKPAKGSKDIINYEAVKKWTAKINLFDYDYIVVPVNENLHWYVAIICNAPKLARDAEAAEKAKLEPHSKDETKSDDAVKAIAESNNSSPSPDSSLAPKTQDLSLNDKLTEDFDPSKPSDEAAADQEPVLSPEIDPAHHSGDSSPPPVVSDLLPRDPKANQPKKGKKKGPPPRKHNPSDFRIITLDSFHGAHSPCCRKLKSYLLKEMKTKLQIEPKDPGSVGMTAKNIPLQSNYSDCGLFLLNYVEEFLKNPDGFIQDILQGSEDLEMDWPPASHMRSRVRDLLFELQNEQHGGGKPEKDVGKNKPTAKVEKKDDGGSASETSTKPPRSSKASPVPGDQTHSNVATNKAVSKKAQSAKAAESGPVEPKLINPPAAPGNARNTEQRRSVPPETTHKQRGIMREIYTTVAGGLSTFSNGILRRSRNISESDPREQTLRDREVIEIEDSTQHSNNPAGSNHPISENLEIKDSQALSSASSSIEDERSSSQNRTSPIDLREIPESPEAKAVQRTGRGKRPRGTQHLESPTPPEDRPLLRHYEDDLKQIALGSPSPEPVNEARSESDFKGFDSDDQRATPVEDEMDLLSPMEVPEPQPAVDSYDGTESEMLLPNGRHVDPSGTREDPESILSSSPVSASTPIKASQRVHSSKSAPSSPGFVHQSMRDDGAANSIKGRKRKSLTDEVGIEHHPRPSPEFRGGSASATVSGDSEKRRRIRVENNEHSASHQQVAWESGFQVDPLHKAVLGKHGANNH